MAGPILHNRSLGSVGVFRSKSLIIIIGFGGQIWGRKRTWGMNGSIEKAAYVPICPLSILTNSLIFNNSYILQLHKNSDSIPPYSIWRAYATFT